MLAPVASGPRISYPGAGEVSGQGVDVWGINLRVLVREAAEGHCPPHHVRAV